MTPPAPRSPAGAEEVESYLTALTAASTVPAIQYLVVTAAGVAYEHCSGRADLHRHAAADPATTMMGYSMSKTITAAAVLQLVERGTVRLDDPVARHVAASPYGPHVTVGQLLAHTSGVPNPVPLRWVHRAADHRGFDEHAALAAVLHRHPRRSFEPGRRYAYSNIGYWLLGAVVEHATGDTFTSYVTRHLLEPLGVGPHRLGYDIADPARHATGYLEKYSVINLVKGLVIDRDLVGDYRGRWLELRSHFVNGAAFGGLVGTATGFGTFLQDQLRDRSVLFDAATRRLFYTPQQTTRGAVVPMTPGWHVASRPGPPLFFKEGGGGGFHSLMRLYPEAGLGTVVLTNATRFDVHRLLNTIDAAFIR